MRQPRSSSWVQPMRNAMLLARRARDSRLKLLGARFAPRAKIMGGLSQGLLSAAAGILAYLPTKPLGLQEGFWASITAIALIQSELGATINSARDQFAGAAIGGFTSAAIVSLAGQSLVAYALAVLVSVMACWVFNVSSAARLAGSTATIIAPGVISTTGSAEFSKANPEFSPADWLRNIPLGRIGATEDIAEVVALLVSDRGKFLAGANYGVDGGMTAR